MFAKAKAAEVWYRHRLHLPVDLRRLTRELGLEVVAFPLRGRLHEVIVDGVVGVRQGLPRPWFRWYVAHAVGHHLLHVGTGFYLESWQWVNVAKAEREAEEFAAWLLAGPEGWRYSHRELALPFEKYLLVRQLQELSPASSAQLTLVPELGPVPARPYLPRPRQEGHPSGAQDLRRRRSPGRTGRATVKAPTTSRRTTSSGRGSRPGPPSPPSA